MKTVTATEANQHFSRILARVEDGETIAITKRGSVVATINPTPVMREEQLKARAKLLERLRSQPAINVPRGTRDELYDDD